MEGCLSQILAAWARRPKFKSFTCNKLSMMVFKHSLSATGWRQGDWLSVLQDQWTMHLNKKEENGGESMETSGRHMCVYICAEVLHGLTYITTGTQIHKFHVWSRWVSKSELHSRACFPGEALMWGQLLVGFWKCMWGLINSQSLTFIVLVPCENKMAHASRINQIWYSTSSFGG